MIPPIFAALLQGRNHCETAMRSLKHYALRFLKLQMNAECPGVFAPGCFFAVGLERFPNSYGTGVATVPHENGHTRRKLERFPGSYGENVVKVPPENGHIRRKLERFPGSYGVNVVTVPPENSHTRRKLERFPDLYGTAVVTTPMKTSFRWCQIRIWWWRSHRQTIMDVVAIGLPRLPLPSGVLICRNLAAWRTDLP